MGSRPVALTSYAGLLGRAGARLEPSTPVRVLRDGLPAGRATVRLALALPVRIRLDRLLAQELGVPRTRLPGLVEMARALRRPVFHGQVVQLVGHGGGVRLECGDGRAPDAHHRNGH